MSDAQTPHNVEAEQAFIGALLYDNELYHKVNDWLKPEHFYDPFHGRVFGLCASLIGAGTAADPVILKSRLDGDEGLAELGGPVYLIDLMREAPDSVSAPEYARLVRELAMRRELIAIGESITAQARDTAEQGTAESLIEYAGEAIHALSETGTRQTGYVPFRDSARGWLETVDAAVKNGSGLAGLSTGIKSLDNRIGGLAKSDLIIIAGRPGMGKTALALNIAFAVAKAGEPVSFNSLEMSGNQLAGRQLAMLTGISFHAQRTGQMAQADMRELIDAQQSLADLPLWVDETGGIDLARLRHRARRIQRRHGLSCLIVDYIQLMTGPSRGDGNRVQEITAITSGLKALAKELNVPIIALSQLSRQVENRTDKRPYLADLRESGSIEQDADMVLFCYREEYYVQKEEPTPGTPDHGVWLAKMEGVKGKAEIIIGKQRHGEQGTVKLAFDGPRTRFYDMEHRT